MATEVLAIPEDYLQDVIWIIQAGCLSAKYASNDVREHLEEWCDEMQAYVDSWDDEDD